MTHGYAWQNLRKLKIHDTRAIVEELRRRHQGLTAAIAGRSEKPAWRPFSSWPGGLLGGQSLVEQQLRLPLLKTPTPRLALRRAEAAALPDEEALEPDIARFDTEGQAADDGEALDKAAMLFVAYEISAYLDASFEEGDVASLVGIAEPDLLVQAQRASGVLRYMALLALIARHDGIEGALVASQLLAGTHLKRNDITCLRAAYRAARQTGLDTAADMLLVLAWAIGDIGFVQSTLATATAPQALAIAPFASSPLLVSSEGIVEPVGMSPVAKLLIIADIRVSAGLIADLVGQSHQVAVAITPRAIRQGAGATLLDCLSDETRTSLAPLVASFSPPYSPAEEELSAHCSRISASITEALAALGDSADGLDLLRLHANSLSIRIDDTVFASANVCWAAARAVEALKPDRIVVVSHDASLAGGLRTILDRRGTRTEILLQGALDNPIDPDIESLAEEIDLPAPDRELVERELAALLAAGRASYAGGASVAQATLFVGRPSDRNFLTDIVRLGTAFRRHSPVLIVPSAVRREEGMTLSETVRSSVPEQAHDLILLELIEGPAHFKPALARTVVRSLYDVVMPEVAARCDPLEQVVLHIARDALQRLINRAVPGMLFTLGRIEAMIDTVRPARVICLPGRDWISRMAIVVARRRDIPTYDMQTVFIGPRSRYKATPADTQIVIDTFSAKIFNAFLSTPKSRIMVAGSVKYGASRSSILAADGGSVRALLSGRGTIILFAASPLIDDCRQVAEALADAVAHEPELGLAIKLHPSSDEVQEGVYREIAQRAGEGSVVVLPRSGLDAAVAAADIVVTRFSNVGFEAALVGKPVIACNFSGEVLPAPLEDMGVAIPARSPAELKAAIADIVSAGPLAQELVATRDQYIRKNRHLLSPHLANDIAAKILAREAKANAVKSRR